MKDTRKTCSREAIMVLQLMVSPETCARAMSSPDAAPIKLQFYGARKVLMESTVGHEAHGMSH